MQNYTDISPDTKVSESLTAILNNDRTAISNSSGTSFPTSNLLVGMTCYRVDIGAMFVLRSLNPAVWRPSSGEFDGSNTNDFVADVGRSYWLAGSFTVMLPSTTDLMPGALVRFAKKRSATPTIVVGDAAKIQTSNGEDTSVIYDIDAELTFFFNGTDWEV